MAAITFLLFAVGAAAAHAADCRVINYASERTKLQRLLSSHGFSRNEQAFLLNGAARRIKEMPRSRLNARGAACGIDAVRAQVLGCLNNLLPSSFRSLPSPEHRIGKPLWGNANVSAREALVIGQFHVCHEAAMEYLFSVK